MTAAKNQQLRHFKDDEPIRLAVAAAAAFPDGSMSASGLRREAAKGRLAIERIAGRDYTTLQAIDQSCCIRESRSMLHCDVMRKNERVAHYDAVNDIVRFSSRMKVSRPSNRAVCSWRAKGTPGREVCRRFAVLTFEYQYEGVLRTRRRGSNEVGRWPVCICGSDKRP